MAANTKCAAITSAVTETPTAAELQRAADLKHVFGLRLSRYSYRRKYSVPFQNSLKDTDMHHTVSGSVLFHEIRPHCKCKTFQGHS